MKRNGMCPICYLKRIFVKSRPSSVKPSYEDYQNGVAATPPMGWSSWNTFRNRINEDMIYEMALALKQQGLDEAGYRYINLDDNWQSSERDDEGNLIGDRETFPSGIPALTDKINALGLKLGAYTSNGTLTCEDLPASLGRERQDAYTLAQWGIEYFKYDFCHNLRISSYAPLIYSISISRGGKSTEYTVQNARLSGLARYMTDKKLPNGRYASGLDKRYGTLSYDNIEVEEDGEYVLTINIKKHGQYEKYLIANVNGKEYEIFFPPQKHHNVTGRFQTVVTLKAGKNSVELYNPITSGADSEMYQYRRMGMALKEGAERVAKERGESVKPILFSICEWGFGKPYNWGAKAGNQWRTTPDIRPWWWWIKMIYNHNVKLYKYSGVGHYNDPDMLEVGNGKLSYNQNVSHFSLWCMMNAPLILGNDLRTMSEQVKAIVTNKNLIAINQDPLCKQAKRVKKGGVDALARPLADGRVALALFNKTSRKRNAKFDLKRLVEDEYVGLKPQTEYTLVEQWSGERLASNGKIAVSLEKCQTKVYIIE